jgi:hypothetical protein
LTRCRNWNYRQNPNLLLRTRCRRHLSRNHPRRYRFRLIHCHPILNLHFPSRRCPTRQNLIRQTRNHRFHYRRNPIRRCPTHPILIRQSLIPQNRCRHFLNHRNQTRQNLIHPIRYLHYHFRRIPNRQNQNHHFQNRRNLIRRNLIRRNLIRRCRYLTRYYFQTRSRLNCYWNSMNLNCWILHRDSADTVRRFCYRFCRYTGSIQCEIR